MHNLLEKDLDFLVRTVADRRTDYEQVKEIVRDKEDLIEIMLENPKLVARIREKQDELLFISPYFLFNVLLRQVRRQLKERSFTLETTGRERIAVFDTGRVSELLAGADLLSYLAETLASFTRIQSGVIFYRVGEKFKRLKFNTLNLANLATLGALLPEEDRFLVYRRMADLCLFMAGIFPDHAGRRLYGGRSMAGSLSLADYQALGPQYYQAAARHPGAEASGYRGILEKMAANFNILLKPIRILAEEYIGFRRTYWFEY